MTMLRPIELSLRYKIPLRVIALVLLTALIVTASMVFREYDESRRDLVAHAAGLGRVLAETLTTPMIHDDLWRAYEVIRSPQRRSAARPSPAQNSRRTTACCRHRRMAAMWPTSLRGLRRKPPPGLRSARDE